MNRRISALSLRGFIAVLFLAILVGCGESDTPIIEEMPSAIPSDDPWLRMEHVDRWTGDLDGMIERGFVRLLVVHSKTYYFFDGARERGGLAEFRLAFEQFLNKKYRKEKKSIKVIAIPVQRDQMIPYLLEGYGDAGAGNWTMTQERLNFVDFTNPTFTNVRELIVLAPDQGDIKKVEDLSGREIHVRRSSSYFESLVALNERFQKEGFSSIKIHPADENLEDEDLAEMVNASLLPATVMDQHKWEPLWSKIFTEAKVNPKIFIRDEGKVAPMIRKDSPQFMALLNEFLKSYGAGTAFMNTVVNRYKSTRLILNANATSERKKYDAVIDFFRKYGDKYNFDYLMLAAQGYQESKLNQSARSPVGAIGIMQLMPKTAAGSPISISNIDKAENNIHAGTKYLRHIVDTYFDIPEMDDVNKMLFSFAAYNAGPTRIARLRELAPEYGFDPNQWFNNVEYIVERRVSREPVRYVGNIYKYYVAYRRLQEMQEQR